MRFGQIIGLLRKNKLLFILGCLLDIGFFAAFFSVFLVIMKRVFDILNSMNDIMKMMSSIPSGMMDQPDAYQAIAGNAEFLSLYGSLLKSIFLLAGLVLVIFLIFEGMSFTITSRTIDQKTNFWRYFGKFCSISVLFYGLLMICFYLTIYMSMLNSKMFFPVFTQGIINFVLIFLACLVFYFWFITLVMIRENNFLRSLWTSLKLGFTKILKMVLIYLTIIISIGICVYLLYLLFLVNIIFTYLGIILVFIPLIAFLRLVFFYFVENVK